MRTFERRVASIAAAACTTLAASGAVAAAASAATITANEACYVNVGASGAAMTITGTGFAPGDPVVVNGGTSFGQTTADPSGSFSLTTAAPELKTSNPGMISTKLTATDDNATLGSITATTLVKSANLSVLTTPGSVKNVRKDKVTFSFSGFTPGKHIYGYYMRKTVVAKARFGKASGPCGLLRQKALLFPGGRPSKDQYQVTFENSSKFSKNVFPRVTGTLSIIHF
jgi:hypothetical protein